MKKSLLAIILASCSTSAMADWGAGLHYVSFINNGDGPDVSYEGAQISLNYIYDAGEGLSIIPQARLVAGLDTEDIVILNRVVKTELDSAYGLAVKGVYELDNGLVLFAEPTYMRLDVTASTTIADADFSLSSDTWKFGIGVGAGYRFNDQWSFDASYNHSDDINITSLGIRFDF